MFLRRVKMRKKSTINFFVFFLLAFGTCGSFSYPPVIVNLSDAKQAVLDYYKSGQYERDMDEAIEEGLKLVRQFTPDGKSAFVFDVDETALSNFAYEIKYDFGYIREEWDKWVMEERAPAIPQVKRFYDSLITWGFKVIFITGRGMNQYQATLNNLKKVGYQTFDTLICRSPEERTLSAVEYKSIKRKELTLKGYRIIGTIGDQWSDHEGGYTILKIKVPNYMYKVE